jgi:Transposase and inactivated derivatives
MARGEELTDEQWAILEPLLPELPKRDDGKGRPWRSNREVLNGILWILRSGARWKDLPDKFPPYQTYHRRFGQWVKDGTLRKVLETLAQDLTQRGQIDLSECFIDGTFVAAKKGGSEWVRLSGAKARNSWWWQTWLLFLSPPTQRVLRRTKSDLSNRLFKRVSLLNRPCD